MLKIFQLLLGVCGKPGASKFNLNFRVDTFLSLFLFKKMLVLLDDINC